MKIRKATYHDAPFIKLLMESLGQRTSVSMLVTQFNGSFSDADHEVIVSDEKDEVIGFAVIHSLPKLGFDKGLLVVSCISGRDQITTNALERHVNELAVKRNAERISL